MRRFLVQVILLSAVLCAGVAYGQQQCLNPTGTITLKPTAINFGQVTVGTSSSQTLSIGNSPNAFRTLLQVTSITSQDSHFSVKLPGPLPFCLAAGQSVQIQVLFSPSTNGPVDSRLQILSSSKSSPDFVAVSGTGIGGKASLKVSPSSLNFGEVKVGKSSTETFSILNQGTASATVDQVSSSNSAFVVQTAFPETIQIGGEIQVTVRFSPSTAGAFTRTLSVISGGQTAATVDVRGSGSGVPNIVVSPLNLDFGSLDMGTFREKMLGISNKGTGQLQVMLVPGTHVLLSPAGPLVIDPGKSIQVKIKLVADALGSISKLVQLTSNDPDQGHLNVMLSASGLKGKLGLLDITQKSHSVQNAMDITGVQWVDFNGDGKEDVYLTGHHGNFLLKNMGSGQFIDVTAKSKLGNNGRDCHGASWADVDNDGDPDLALFNANGSLVYKNNKGVFAVQGSGLGMFASDNSSSSQGGIWLDFNNDGRLDLLVIKDGKPNQLFKQTGLFHFVDVAASAGIALNSSGRSAVAADFNNDGYVDLYIANFNHPNKLYINRKNETFADMTQSAGVGFNGASEQVIVTDYNGDGNLDIFVANSDGTSVLYRNSGKLKFTNVTARAGLTGPKNATAATFSDFDNDGDLDLLIVQAPGEDTLFRNVGKGKFVKVSNVDVSHTTTPSSTSSGDVNNDGAPDVVVGGDDGSSNSVYSNTGGEGNNWLVLILQGTASNRSAIGAKVVLRAGLIAAAKVITAGNGQSQDSLPLEFGLGGATSATVLIVWPSGKVQTMDNIQANQKLKITEPSN